MSDSTRTDVSVELPTQSAAPHSVDRPKGDWDAQAESHRSSDEVQVLKQADTFAIFDRLGEVGLSWAGEKGLYHCGTRHLSGWELLINGQRPLLLNSTMQEDNSRLIVQMTTQDLSEGDGVLPQGTLHVFRSMLLDRGSFYEHLRLTNYSTTPVALVIEYRYDADFRDIFEIRGARRARRGELLRPQFSADENDGSQREQPQTGDCCVTLNYRGLDECLRKSKIFFGGGETEVTERYCRLSVQLDAGAEVTLYATVNCCAEKTHGLSAPLPAARSHAEAVEGRASRIRREISQRTEIFTSNQQFNSWINRSNADLDMLITDTVYGAYPYAGVPWFATPFGRDGLITALETLWVRPKLARGVLSFLAATQANEVDSNSEAEPGKIIHEMRDGEMAALGEVPFRRYYGTVDATPLFLMLAGKYFRRTGDREFIEVIWPNIRRAVRWIDEFGDCDGDGFVEYQSHNARGLTHQCWKDSNDSIFHADGSMATGAIAVSEVQAYVYEAKMLVAEMAERFNDEDWADTLRAQAAELKQKFNEIFWVGAIETYAIALDGNKRKCAVRNSNAGHLLYSGIVDPHRAEQVTRALMDENGFNGWGIRTISKGEARYNPMSYHNGSVWPHDTAMVAAGMAQYGFRKECGRAMAGLFEASLQNDLNRLPELFCGFDRLPGHAPTLYPVACSPQAWATGAVFLLLQSMLGLTFSPDSPQVRFENPQLPDFLDWVRIQNLQIAGGSVDLAFRRHPRDVGMNVERKEGDIQIVVIG